MNMLQCAGYAHHFFFHGHMKIVVGVELEIVQMLQKHMDPEITQ